jgi:hypothetical protein
MNADQICIHPRKLTKSGTNEWHGSAFEFFRDEALNSNTPSLPLANAKRPKSQINQFGATIGGPIKRDRKPLAVSSNWDETISVHAKRRSSVRSSSTS